MYVSFRMWGLNKIIKTIYSFLARWSPSQDGRVEGCALIFSCEVSKKTTCYWTIIDRRMLDPTKKDTPCPRSKEKPQQDCRRDEIMFRIKPHTCQRCLEGSNRSLCAPGPGYPTETEPNLPLSAWVSPVEVQANSGLCRGRGSGWSRPGSHSVLHKDSWRRSPLTPP